MSTKKPHLDKENKSENPQNVSDNQADKHDSFDKEALPEKIGMNLRQIYDDVLAEPVPDDFLSLLAKADKNSS